MNILITGGNGQLGQDCRLVFSRDHTVTAVDIEDLDITDENQVAAYIRNLKPDIIINCAAFTQVDVCETQRQAAEAVNMGGPEHLAKSARAVNALMVHISTDYVFDGKKKSQGSYVETDIPSPISHYGRTKLSGERSVINNTNNFIILRTAWLYGVSGNNFIKTILKKVLNHPDQPLKIVNDQMGSPTWSHGLALQVAHLIHHKGNGLYHASSEGSCSWYTFARYFLEKLNIDPPLNPCTTDEYPSPAVRPQCAILENRRLKNENLNIMRHWQTDLDEFVRQYGDRLIRECRQ